MRELSLVIRGTAKAPVLLLLGLLLLPACRQDRPHTPLTRAAELGDLARTRSLLQSGSDPDEPGPHGWPPLLWPVRDGHLEAIRLLVEAGADPDLPDGGINGWTPLLHAVHKGQLSSIRALLDAGADPDAASPDGFTPLMMAAGYGRDEQVRYLLARGADIRAATSSGHTALSLAVRGASDIDRFTVGSCQIETIRVLLDHSPDLRLPDNRKGHWALRTAKLFGCAEVVDLVTRPAAAASGRVEIVRAR